jgi:hypothetical protein
MTEVATERDLVIWTIYDHPRDFPNTFVARKFAGARATNDIMVAARLDDIRNMLERMGLVCLGRQPDDDPKIVEMWL